MFELYDKINKAKLEIPNTPKRSNDFKYFLKKCFERDPNKRITSEKILDLKWVNLGEKENLKDQCKKAVKFKLTKEEINKDIGLFWIDYKYIKSFKEDERPVIKKFANKLLEKIPNVKDERKIKIKIKPKKSKKAKNDAKDEDKQINIFYRRVSLWLTGAPLGVCPVPKFLFIIQNQF